MSTTMKKFLYRKIVRKPSADALFFEEYLDSIGDDEKKQKFISISDTNRTKYFINSSYKETFTDTEQITTADYTELELEQIVNSLAELKKFPGLLDLDDEIMEFTFKHNIYFQVTVKELLP